MWALGMWVWSAMSVVTSGGAVYEIQSRVPYLTAHQALGHPWPVMKIPKVVGSEFGVRRGLTRGS